MSLQLSGHLTAILLPPMLGGLAKCAPAGEALLSNVCQVAVVADRQLPHLGNNFV